MLAKGVIEVLAGLLYRVPGTNDTKSVLSRVSGELAVEVIIAAG